MQQVIRNDPAPSRLRYRAHRLWLTPVFRLLMRVGLPLTTTLVAGTVYLSDQDRQDAILLWVAELKASIEERPEFMVNLMAIDGASDNVAEDIREVVPIDFPVSSFDLDLDQIRSALAELDPIKRVSVRVRPGGVLQIDVEERVPVVVWRTRDGLEQLDETGSLVGPLEARSERADLPLIAGEGADGHVTEALALFAAARPLAGRLRGLVRVGDRRWDVVLDRDQRILLPETGAVAALERALALDAAKDLLARDLVAVDLRNPERPTLRMTEHAVQELWRIRATHVGDD